MIRMISIALFVLLISILPSFAQIPVPLKNATVTVEVTKETTKSIYIYSYSIFNPKINEGQIFSFDVDISSNPADAILGREGLINGPCYHKHTSEFNLQRIQMVPVGIDGPAGYLPDFPKAAIWGCGLSAKGSASWGSTDEPYLIFPGKKLEGFKLQSHGLPGIRQATIEPAIDYDNLPAEYYENVELTKQLQDSLIYETKTIGPTAPPADFKPFDFLDYIVSLKHQAYNLGWISQVKGDNRGNKEDDEKGIMESLDKKLEKAREKLVKGDTEEAVEKLKSFIHEVEALYKGDKDDERERDSKSKREKEDHLSEHISSEAYALLKYNAQHLIEKLGGEKKKREDKKD